MFHSTSEFFQPELNLLKYSSDGGVSRECIPENLVFHSTSKQNFQRIKCLIRNSRLAVSTQFNFVERIFQTMAEC
jgi:hypothetical protein